MAPDSALLELVGIEKSFAEVRALSGASLSVRRGEILGLYGEAGAGKTTLVKVLCGAHAFGSYSGKILLDGRVRRFRRPSDALDLGIAVVHQASTLVPELTVAENLLLGREPRRFGLIDGVKLEARACEMLAQVRCSEIVDVRVSVRELGAGLRRIVQIVRALSLGAQLLVLDEPAAALTARETRLLLSWLAALKQRGTACIYVSPRLDEMLALCDRVTVLRAGRTRPALVASEVEPESVAWAMLG